MKFVIAMLTCLVLAVGSVSAGNLLAGGGATVSMFNTQGPRSETTPFSLLGYGLTTNPDFGNGIIPHETYLIGQLGRVKDLTSGEYITISRLSICGLWYFTDSTSKWQTFFVLRANEENQANPGGNISYLNGQFGLGASHGIAKHASAWGAFTFVMGAKISTDIAAGFKFGI